MHADYHFRNLYLEALAEKDFGAATRCLENLGMFEKHQQQKQQYSQTDVERLRAELEQVGVDFRRVNFPGRN